MCMLKAIAAHRNSTLHGNLKFLFPKHTKLTGDATIYKKWVLLALKEIVGY